MKYIKHIILLFVMSLLLASCNLLQKDEEGNLIDMETLTEGSWIGFNGELHEKDDFVHTEFINYNPMNDYTLNRNAYVSYYDDEAFLKTILHTSSEAINSESGANKIKISFNKDRLDSIELLKE